MLCEDMFVVTYASVMCTGVDSLSVRGECCMKRHNDRCGTCRGVEAAADAVEHLQSGRSIGKVVLQIAEGAGSSRM